MQVKNTPKMLIRNWGLEGGEICINVADFLLFYNDSMGIGHAFLPSTRKVRNIVALWTDPYQLNFADIF